MTMKIKRKRNIHKTAQFRKDVKKAIKQHKDMDLLEFIIDILADDIPLPQKYLDHPMKGNRKGFRECHIEPDWLLMYRKIDDDVLELLLARVGSHSELGIG